MADPRYPIVMLGGVPVVEAPPEVDAVNAESLQEALRHAARYGDETVVVNMTRTRFCDSSGIHVLASAHEWATGEGGRLLLVLPPAGAVPRVFAITGLDRPLPIFTDLSEALEQAGAVVSRPFEGMP